MKTVVVAGAGLAGSLMACYLGRAGYRVKLVERRGDPRGRDVDAGRSINLAISTRGITALKGVGLDRRVLDRAVPMRGRMMHAVDGELTFQRYGTDASQVINSVSRLGLNLQLLEAAEVLDNVELIFNRRCVDVDLDAPAILVRDEQSGQDERIEGDAVIGADGAFSAVRARMQRNAGFDYAQAYLDHGYKELTIPPGSEFGDTLELNALHIWPRGGFMMIALPNLDGTWTCTLFWPYEGPDSFAAVSTPQEVSATFERVFPDAVPLMPRLAEEYFENPTSSLVTIRCEPWNRGATCLLGDSAHAIVPFYGQGANAAFEDCRVLAEILESHPDDFARAFEIFAAERKPHAEAVADLALDNFIEMRDSVQSRWFLLRNRFEKFLNRLMPERYIPLYIMVSFTNIPYAEARRRAASQWNKVKRFGQAALAAFLGALLIGLLT